MAIDIASGTVELDVTDIALVGQFDLVWDRRYCGNLVAGPPKMLGRGWTNSYQATLTRNRGGFEFVTPKGSVELIPDPEGLVEQGETVRHLGAYLEVFASAGRFVVQNWNVRTDEVRRYVFIPAITGQPMLLTSIEDASGQGIDLSRDLTGRLTGLRQRLEQRTLELEYGLNGLLSIVGLRDTSGRLRIVRRYEYDARNFLSAVFDAQDNADRYEYAPTGHLSREIAKDGGVTSYRYDDRQRCVWKSGLDNYDQSRLRFLDAVRTTEVTNSYGRTTRYQYLASGQIAREIDPLGRERLTKYDDLGRIEAEVEPSGATTTYAYDDAGNRTVVADAVGNKQVMTFNDDHLPTSLLDPRGYLWLRVYDPQNRLIGTTDPLLQRWSVSYDTEGKILEIANPLGDARRFVYTDGVVTSVVDWNGAATHLKVDGFGRLTERRGPLGDKTVYTYDDIGNAIQVRLPQDVTLRATYDPVGNMTSVTDGNGAVTTFRYGPCRRLIERVSCLGHIVRYVWGHEPGYIEQIVNEKGETYKFFRDETGQVVGEQAFDGSVRSFAYDVDGYLISYTNANGETTSLVRDALHRTVRQKMPAGEASFAFDENSNLVSAVNSDIGVTFERDAYGHIVREQQGEVSVESRYDPLGRLVGTSTSLGHTVNYKLDATGLVVRMAAGGHSEFEFTRSVYGEEVVRQMSGSRLEQEYDDLGRLREQRVLPWPLPSDTAVPSRVEVLRRVFSYDRNSSVTSIFDRRWGNVTYAYDPAARLMNTFRERGPNESFSYDDAGNLSGMQSDFQTPDTALVLEAGARLASKDGTRYEYDPEGRRICMIQDAHSDLPQMWKYEWDVQDRLRAVTRPDGQHWTYKYDALGRRVAKVGPGERREFVWDKDVIVHECVDKQSVSAWMFDANSFVPVATIQGGRIYSIVCDQIGTPREMIDTGGNVAWSILLSSWGTQVETNGISATDVTCPVRFQGQWFDQETGLHYNRYRYYDPQAACYISQDPIGLSGGLNLYAYAWNPCNFVDPTGLCAASDLPPLKGKGHDEIRSILTKAGFTKTKVSNSPGRNETWDHPDGSQVRIHPYGDVNQKPYKTANNAHVHKESASGQQLNDKGQPAANKAEEHIGIPNPPDLPSVRGRPHGAGTS